MLALFATSRRIFGGGTIIVLPFTFLHKESLLLRQKNPIGSKASKRLNKPRYIGDT